MDLLTAINNGDRIEKRNKEERRKEQPQILKALRTYFDDMKTRNKDKELDMFLYKRDIEIIHFTPRVFIKNDARGKKFIEDVLCDSNFKKKLANLDRPYVDLTVCDEHFRFEFVNPKEWNHIELAVEITVKTGNYQIFDEMVKLLMDRIEHNETCFLHKPKDNSAVIEHPKQF